MSTTVTENGIKTTITSGKVLFEGFSKGEYDKAGSKTAQLRQIIKVKTIYPAARTNSNMEDSFFSAEQFGDGETYDRTENRVAWMRVPEDVTEAQFNALLTANPECCLYRVMSSKPIISDKDQSAIDSNLRTYDQFAEKQVVRNSETQEIILHNSQIQYRRVFFSKTTKEDIDNRNAEEAYVPASLSEELSGAIIQIEQAVL